MQVNFYATLRPIVGGRTVELEIAEGLTVRELVVALVVALAAAARAAA
jgi:sulfur-carrier protein